MLVKDERLRTAKFGQRVYDVSWRTSDLCKPALHSSLGACYRQCMSVPLYQDVEGEYSQGCVKHLPHGYGGDELGGVGHDRFEKMLATTSRNTYP